MPESQRLVTAEELARMPSDDSRRYELVEGRLVRMSPVSFDHGQTVVRLLSLLTRHLSATPVGVVVTEVGFTLATSPDTVRAPDIAFLRNDRVPPRGTRGFLHEAPAAVFEVLSPDDRPSEMRRKIAEYLEKGVAVVVVVDPDDTSVTSYRRDRPPAQLAHDDDLLDVSDAIDGFRCSVREIFE